MGRRLLAVSLIADSKALREPAATQATASKVLFVRGPMGMMPLNQRAVHYQGQSRWDGTATCRSAVCDTARPAASLMWLVVVAHRGRWRRRPASSTLVAMRWRAAAAGRCLLRPMRQRLRGVRGLTSRCRPALACVQHSCLQGAVRGAQHGGVWQPRGEQVSSAHRSAHSAAGGGHAVARRCARRYAAGRPDDVRLHCGAHQGFLG